MKTMEERSVIHSTFVIDRSYSATPERVFGAFADPAKKRRWFVESDHHEVEYFEMDFRVGGMERSRYRFKEGSPLKGLSLSNEFAYQDIVPNRRIITASTMTIADKLVSASLVTIEFLPSEKGTDLVCTHQGVFFEGSGGPEMREHGWRTLFDRLAAEVSR
jgi:uncharacterized protein YndB with AHSA1/START domain